MPTPPASSLRSGRQLLLPGNFDDRKLGGVLFGIEGADDGKDRFLPGRLAQHLPDGVYRFANAPHDARLAALAFALGTYRFTRYRKAEPRAVGSICRKASIATTCIASSKA